MGGGVAGITLASQFVGSGHKVILVESGSESYQPDLQKLYQAEKFPAGFPDPTHSRLRMLGGSSNHWENSTERFDPIDFQERESEKS